MKTMCPPGYHHNGFVATHALGHMMYMSCHKAIVVITGRAHCFHDYIYIYIYIHMYMYVYVYVYIYICVCVCVCV